MASRSNRLEPVVRSAVADAAYESIRNAIVSGVFAPGEQLIETKIAETIGVGRGTAREALRRMRDEGLVVGSPNRGVFVRELTLRDIVNVYDVRIGLESVAVRLCARAGVSVAGLQRTIEQMRGRAAAGDLVGLSDREVAFHEELCRASGNEFLVAAFRSVGGATRLAFAVEYVVYPDPGTVPDEHLPIVEAIESGDEERAERTLIEHIDVARSIELARMLVAAEEQGEIGELVSNAGIASWR